MIGMSLKKTKENCFSKGPTQGLCRQQKSYSWDSEKIDSCCKLNALIFLVSSAF